MSLTMNIENRMPGYFIITLHGRLDSLTYAECEARITPLLIPSTKVMLFEMADLNYISSMGLRVIIKARKFIEGNQGKFSMINLQPQIEKIFEIAQMLPKQPIFSSIEEVDRYFDAMQKKVLDSLK